MADEKPPEYDMRPMLVMGTISLTDGGTVMKLSGDLKKQIEILSYLL